MRHALYLTPVEVDAIVQALRNQPGDHIQRGRGGDGYACRDGQFFSIYVEECDQSDSSFADEAAFRAHLAGLDLNDGAANRYRAAVFAALDVHPANDVADEARLRAALEPDRLGRRRVYPWRGMVRDAVTIGGFTYLRFATDGVAVALRWPAEEDAAFATAGVSSAAAAGRRIRASGVVVDHAPTAGAWAIQVASPFSVQLEPDAADA